VRLQVTEGKVERVRVVGSRYYSQGYILSKTPALKEGTAPNFQQVQRDIAALNTGATRVVPVLRPGQRLGTSDVDLNVEDQAPYHANVELSNLYSPNTTALRLTLGFRYDNLWQRQHSVSVQYLTSPQDVTQVKALSAAYFAPLPGSNQLIGVYGVHSRSNVAAVGDLTVFGNGDIVGLRWVNPIVGSEKVNQSVVLGLDYKNFQQTVNQPGTGGVNTPIQYFSLVANYFASLIGARGVTQLTAGVVLGVRGPASDNAAFNNDRSGAGPNFAVFKWSAERTQNLPREFSIYGRLDGQIADQPLISNEQFTASALESVRGYLEAEVLGDNAVHATLELRTPSLLSSRANELRFHVFVDGAHLKLIDPLPSQTGSFNIYSAGLGLRLTARALSAVLDIGVPLKDTTYTQAGEVRLQFVTSYVF
jgi:hemolysin activation/secretion protein